MDISLLAFLPIVALLAIGGFAFLLRMSGPEILNTFESVLAYVGGKVKQSLPDMCDIESVEDETTFILKDGSRLSLIELKGSFVLIGTQEFDANDAAINSSLRAYLKSGGHEVHIVFTDDPDAIERQIRESLRPSIATAERLNLQLDDLFEEEVKTLSRYCSAESTYMVLLTRPAALSAQERKSDLAAKVELLNANPLPRADEAPNFFRGIAALRNRHTSFVTALLSDVKGMKLDAAVLDVHSAARAMRASADSDFTDETWRPRLFGDKIPVRLNNRAAEDMSGMLWPRLDSQLIPRDGVELNLKTFEVGDRIYAPLHITIQPEEIKPFMALFTRVREGERRMPWRITFRILPGGMKAMAFKGFVGAVFGWSSKENGLIERAITHVKEVIRDGGEMDASYRVDLMTWAPRGQEKLLAERASRLARALQGWGGAESSDTSGDVGEAFVANCLGLKREGLGTVSCAALSDITPMLPLYRPASPWKQGAVMYRTPDGKPWPYQPNSPVQSSWITLMFAEMRAGKTVNGNMINLALCLSPGLVRLPMIGVIDVGRGSSGLISLLEHALPESERYQVASIRMRMSEEFATNPFDTQLGARRPTPLEHEFQRNLMLTVVTPPGEEKAADGMDGLVSMAIDYAHDRFSAPETAKRYEKNIPDAKKVYEAVERHGIVVDESTTWYEVTDDLFDRGDHHAASIAQRYAVPILPDFPALVREPQFVNIYGEKKLTDGETLLNAFSRMISEAVRAYPILSRATCFDIGLARVVSLDLDEVAKFGGSATAKKQTALCYMLARQIVARNFYLHEDMLGYFEPRYRPFQEKRIREIMQDKKHLQYDEFHRTEGVNTVREQVVADMRECGKYGVMVSLISQSMDDFHPLMLEFASTKFILSRANEDVARKMKEKFGMSATVEYAVKHRIKPPSRDGSTFVGMFKTKMANEDCVQLLNNTAGGIKLWAFSTTSEDAFVRDQLYRRFGPQEARRFLSKMFPGGSVQDELERRKQAMSNSGMIDTTLSDDGVVVALADDLAAKFETIRQAALAA